MIVNELYEDQIDHSWIKILSNNLSKIEESAQYEDDESFKLKFNNDSAFVAAKYERNYSQNQFYNNAKSRGNF